MDGVTNETRTIGAVVDAEHPWPGLVSYTEEGAAFFFGREREVAELTRLVRQEVLTVLFGKSGLGKSSLLRAGLAPLLRASEFLPIFIRLDHSEASPSLESQVHACIAEALEADRIEADAPAAGESLWEYFHRKGHDWWDAENRLLKPVLIFDQFEELLTAGRETPAREARIASFLTELEDLVEDRVPASLQKRFEAERGLARQYDFERLAYRVILALREDFLADLEGLHERLRQIISNRFRLLPMSGTQAMDVILKPQAHPVSEAVAIEIVNFVSSSERSRLQQRVTRELVANRQVEPALLSVVLQELNNHRIQSGAPTITADLVGGRQATEILENFFERGLEGMDDHVREFIVDELLTTSGARNRVAEEDALNKYDIPAEVISTLIDRRIFQRHSSGSVKWLELTHDTLADVVRADRADQAKRREVAEATAREAAVRHQLARTHRLVSAFALLLILAASGLAFALYSQSRLRTTNRDLAEQRTKLENTNRQLVEQQTALAVARDGLAGKNDELRSRAETEADEIVDEMRKELDGWRGGAAPHAIEDLGRIVSLSTQFDSPLLKARHALAQALGAEVLYQYGYIGEGVKAAGDALAVAEAVARTAPAGDPQTALILAGARYAVGRGAIETGRYDDAEVQLRAAGRAAETALKGEASVRIDAHRIHALTQLGLGDVDLRRGATAAAHATYERLLTSLDRAPSDLSGAVPYLRAQTLRRLAQAEDEDEKADPYFNMAGDIVRRFKAQNPDDLRWTSLSAELAYRRAASMMTLGRFDEPAGLLREARDAAAALYQVDRDNIRTAWILALVDDGLATLYQKSGDNGKALSSIQEGIQLTDRASLKQPSWVVIRGLNGVIHFHRGELAGTMQTAQGADKQREEATKAREYAASMRILSAVARDAPGDAEHQRNVSVVANEIGVNQSNRKDYDGALRSFELAQRSIGRIPAALRSRPRFQSMLAYTKKLAGFYVYLPSGRREDAQKAYMEAIRIDSEVVAASPTPANYGELADTYRWLGDLHLAQASNDRAADAYAKSIAAYDQGISRFSKNDSLLNKKADMALYFAGQWRKSKQLNAAISALTLSTETALKGLRSEPIQFDMYQLLTKANTEGTELLKIADAAAEKTTQRANPQLDTLRRQIELTSNVGRLLRPNGAKVSASDANILEVDRPQQWRTPPLIPGTWRQMHADEQEAEKARLSKGSEFEKRIASELVRIRTLPLNFYDGATLYEVETPRSSGGVYTYVRVASRDGYILVLDGRSPPVRDLNKSGLLRLDSPAQAAQYMRFFTNFLTSEEGNFRVVDSEADLNFTSNAPSTLKERLGRLVLPLQLRRDEEGKWYAKATVRYGSNLFYAVLRVDNLDGEISMAVDTPAATKLPLLFERLDGGIRTLTDKTWKAEVEDLRKTVERLRGSVTATATAQQKQALCGAYLGLSWYQLHTKDFAGALESTEAGLKVDPAYLALDTNRAHALVFLNRLKEADEIYRINVGKRMADKQAWTDVIREDLDILERDGLTSPHFTSVRAIMRGAKE